MATPTTATPFEAKSRCSLLKLGISLMQGTHQVAQKLTTATLPARSTGLPSSDVSVRPGPDAGAAEGEAPAPFCKKARNSAESLVRPGKVAITFSSGSRMA